MVAGHSRQFTPGGLPDNCETHCVSGNRTHDLPIVSSTRYQLCHRDHQLHWLPIEWRIRFKLACLVHKILNTGHPPYLTELLQYHKPSKSTRSSASHLLSVPRTPHNLSFGARAFRVAAPKIWNSIPLHIRQSQTYSSFRCNLKTYYFISAHLAP